MKFRLLTKHYMYDTLLDEGTIVGDETPFKITDDMISTDMEGLDDASKKKVEEAREKMPKPQSFAPQLGILYLEPEVQAALVEAAKKQQGAVTPTGPANKESATAPRR